MLALELAVFQLALLAKHAIRVGQVEERAGREPDDQALVEFVGHRRP